MKWSTIGKGLLAMAGALLIAGTALTHTANVAYYRRRTFIFAVALKAIGSAIKSFGGMSWERSVRV